MVQVERATRAARQPAGVGELLRSWRNARRKSQLALSLDAGVSARHVSFVESGRSRPSREMVLALAGALDVPLRERNDLLLAAGYAPIFRESDLSTDELAILRRAVESILVKQEPFPAVVLDRRWNLLQSNLAARRFFSLFLGQGGASADRASDGTPESANLVRLMLDPNGLRPFVLDWETVARALVGRIHREAVGGLLDQQARELLDEIRGFPDMARALDTAPLPTSPLPVVPVGFVHEGRTFRFFSTVTTVGTPQDVTSQEIRIECFFPVDRETEENLRAACP